MHKEGQVDAHPVAFAKAKAHPKIKWIWHSVITRINGEKTVTSVTVRDLTTEQTQDLATNGVFVLIGTRPQTDLLTDHLALDAQGYIITDRQMQTSQEGVYAGGDARVKYLRQVVTAVSDGAIAAVAASRYLYRLKGEATNSV